jgi:hypothetical protein
MHSATGTPGFDRPQITRKLQWRREHPTTLHALEIEAKTLYSAILHFNAEAICHPAYGLPKPTDDMVFDVEVDGKVYTRTFRHAMDWSNWKTDRDHAKLERLRRRD